MSHPLLYLVFTSCAYAGAFNAPRATSQAEIGDLLFPPEPTAPPKVPFDLLRRQNADVDFIAPDNTCGYISGLAGAAYYCLNTSAKCAFIPSTSSSVGVIACCDTNNCNARLTCIDSAHFYTGSICDNGCQKDTFTLKCTALSAPYCNGIKFPVENVEDYFCDSISVSTWQLAYTTYSFESDGRRFSPLTITSSTSGPTTTTSTPCESCSTSPSPIVLGPQSTSPTTTSITPAPLSSSSDSTPIGAIVGGAVGGAAGISIIVLIVWLLLRRNKEKDSTNAVRPPTYIQPQDPNNSAYAAAAAGKPAPTTQETTLNGPWAPPVTQTQYPPQAYQQQYQQPYQQPYPPMAEAQGGYGQQQQNLTPGYYNQNPNQPYYSQTSPPNMSPNSQSHLSSVFPDRNEPTSPASAHRASGVGMPGSEHSHSPTMASNMAGPRPGAPAPQPGTGVEGRAEMSANMAGGPFPMNLHEGTYEVPGSDLPRY